jgi:hypothetical protein
LEDKINLTPAAVASGLTPTAYASTPGAAIASGSLIDPDAKVDRLLQEKEQISQREMNRRTRDFLTSSKMIPSSKLALESTPFAIGSSSKVYRATFSKQIVAAKVQTVEGSTPKQLLDIMGKFEKELALLCQLSHPNVLSVWGACTDSPGALILVMEYAKVFVVRSFLAIRALSTSFRRVVICPVQTVSEIHCAERNAQGVPRQLKIPAGDRAD